MNRWVDGLFLFCLNSMHGEVARWRASGRVHYCFTSRVVLAMKTFGIRLTEYLFVTLLTLLLNSISHPFLQQVRYEIYTALYLRNPRL
jgi:hypothetical protein